MTIPATHTEIEQIYLNAEMQGCRSICITACNSGEGSTSIASSLAERYILAGYRTLLVDMNLFSPSFAPIELPLIQQDAEMPWVEDRNSKRLFCGYPVPQDQGTMLMYKDPTTLRNIVTKWREKFERIVIDTSPILNVNRGNIPAQCVASAVDGTFLVVLSGTTLTSQIEEAIDILGKAANATILGTVLNTRDQPTLASEMCREIDRLKFTPKKMRAWLKRKVSNNRFLSMQV